MEEYDRGTRKFTLLLYLHIFDFKNNFEDRAGFLTYDEFLVLAELILKNYELLPDKGETHVGKYKLKRKLGSGSSGTVWLALNVASNEKKALKVINKSQAQDMNRVDVEIKV